MDARASCVVSLSLKGSFSVLEVKLGATDRVGE